MRLPQPVAEMVVIAGPDTGLRFGIGEGRVSVGRGIDDDLQLRDVCVTHHQLLIEWDAGSGCHVAVQTGDSATAFNDVPAGRNAGVRHTLANGDEVRIGRTVLRYSRAPHIE